MNNIQKRTIQSNISCFPCDQDEEDFLFEKGDLNLWAEPVQWVKLLHRRLVPLATTSQMATGSAESDQVQALSTQARARALSSQQALDALPALPQFSCTMEHARLLLRHQRATLALDVLERLKQQESSMKPQPEL